MTFGTEDALEDFLTQRWSAVCTFLGIDLLLIGRQVRFVPDRQLDLLAIDIAGRLYIIELKLGETPDRTAAQILEYRQRIKRQTLHELVKTLRPGTLRVDLAAAFEQHFNRALPQSMATPPAVVVIARAITPRIANSVLELLDLGYPISVFTYAVIDRTLQLKQIGQEGLIQLGQSRKCDRRAVDTSPAQTPHRSGLAIEWFWAMQSQQFRASIVTFRTVWALYEEWHYKQVSTGVNLTLCNQGELGSKLKSIVENSEDWKHVYIASGFTPDPFMPTAEIPPYVRKYHARHTTVAYLRTTAPTEGLSSARQGGRIWRLLSRNRFYSAVIAFVRLKQIGDA